MQLVELINLMEINNVLPHANLKITNGIQLYDVGDLNYNSITNTIVFTLDPSGERAIDDPGAASQE